ncbi:ATP-dependent DNA helicase RecG [Labedella endophytica]|uniref:Probable DNA 3'-5' helicase RecG n=1 Tax=Labedella endophytica TaxID=1523160 RepID=A0A3S0WV83_9MICO|nr:ATP-dependent DNA helicase RecG [Labedella endophytica]RUQ97597.1 ATP-dependent DNA helicase RecG [Labedella endophytica]
MTALGLDDRLDGVLGAKTAGVFERAFGFRSVGDLLSHYPRRYARRGDLTVLSELPMDENVTIVAQVVEVNERPMRARRGSILEVLISDGNGALTLTFFNQSWRANDLKPGRAGVFAGKIGSYKGLNQLAHPTYELFEPDAPSGISPKVWAETPIPIYPATAAVTSWVIQKSIALVLDGLGPIDDPVPGDVAVAERILGLRDALERVHRPQDDPDWKRARETLRFHEAFVLQAGLLQRRLSERAERATERAALPGGALERFDAALPFDLTDDQRVVGAEIAAELASGTPMNRLVQGEVGSGKTLVALRAMLAVAESGGQSALLAPTEVLAAQHLRSIVASLGPDLAARLAPVLLTGQMSTAERRKALLRIVSGQAQIVVGTHALLSSGVEFYDLGLVVVDEQHRFGVEQREALRRKGSIPPHVLVLTATPIPRTVAMTVFGDLDVSSLRQLPAGRQPIESFVVPLAEKPLWIRRAWERLSEELAAGRQAFVVCPAIEPGEKIAAEDGAESPADDGDGPGEDARPPLSTVSVVLEELRAHPSLAGRVIEPLHGRMTSDEKDRVMRGFADAHIDVLVATTVIEVGVDVPGASMMVVLDADRFGVSQLHQLRGRVGRGGLPGLCLLVTNAPEETIARDRVEAVAATLDGFELAQVDLELRREGDVLGSAQSGGRSSLKLLRVVSDSDVIERARRFALDLLTDDPALESHRALRDALERRLDEQTRAALAKN